MRHRRLVVLVLFIGWALLTRNLTIPWFGHHDANGVWVSAGVLNWHRYGFDTLRGMIIINYAPATSDTFAYYPNHPPLTVWSIGLTSVLAGVTSTELIGRWTMACFTLISMAGVYIFTRRIADKHTALIAMLIYILTPMVAYYGRMPNHEAPALAFITLFSAVLAKWLIQPTWIRILALCLLVWLGIFTAWSASLIIACLGLAGLILANNTRQRLMLMIVGVAGLLGLLAMLLYYEWGKSGAVNTLIRMFSARTDATSSYQTGYAFTVGEFILDQIGEMLIFATPAVCILGMMGLLYSIRRSEKNAKWLMGALFIGGLSYILILRDPAFSHDFLKIFMLPPLAMGMAMIIQQSHKTRLFRLYGRAFIVTSFLIGMAWFITLHLLASSQTAPYHIAQAIAK
ncbi:MAG: glycosyltransferase family 39 protein, partial [Anaerolineae bacterium]|nr:glycosyltransferase family 39 protein [Anaerolineae bacterium]